MKESKRESKLFSNTIMLYIMQMSGYIFPLLTFPYLTRVLGPKNYGIVVFTNSFMAYFQMFVDYGFILSATNECSIHRDNNEKLGQFVNAVIKSKIFLSIIGLIVIFILTSTITIFKENKFFILLSYIPIFSSAFIPDYLFRGIEKMESITYRTIVSRGIFTILILFVIKEKNQYILIPIFNTIANICIIIMAWFTIRKKLGIKIISADLKLCVEVIKKSTIFFISRVATTLYGSSNTFVLGFKFSSITLAQYGVSSSLILNIKNLFGPLADSLYPYMVRKKNYKLVKQILVITLPIVFIGTMILYIFAEPFITLACGNKYTQAAYIFRAMLPIVLIGLPSYLLGFPVLGSMGRLKEANLSTVYASIFHIVFLLILLIFNKLTFLNVAKLTCVSEFIVLLIRIAYIMKFNREKKIYERTNEATSKI